MGSMLLKAVFYLSFIFSVSASAKPLCSALFIKSNINRFEQLFTSLELDYRHQMAIRKYSLFDLLKVRRDLMAHSFIKDELSLPKAFIVPEVTKQSMLEVRFRILPDARPLSEYIHISEVKSKFDLALNLIIKQTKELGYPWSLKFGRYYLSPKNIPKIKFLSLSEAKREIYDNNRIVLFANNSETKTYHQLYLTVDSFLYSSSTGQLIFSALY